MARAHRSRLLRAACGWAVALAMLAAPAAAEDVTVDVELVIAVDVSLSMAPRELEIQRRGYAEALVSPDVVAAIASGPHGQVAVTYVEWAGVSSQRVVVDWTLLRGRADAEAMAARLAADFGTGLRRTSISAALDFAARSFEGNGFAGLRRVIDVSGDGPNNDGRAVTAARDDAVARGIVINGLPLMTREGMGSQWHLDDLDRYYRDCVIGGPGAFVIPVLEWRDFADAVRAKLVLDLVGLPAPARMADRHAAPIPADAPAYDCFIGERIWNRMQEGWN